MGKCDCPTGTYYNVNAANAYNVENHCIPTPTCTFDAALVKCNCDDGFFWRQGMSKCEAIPDCGASTIVNWHTEYYYCECVDTTMMYNPNTKEC